MEAYIFSIVVLIFSVVIHEVSHGYVAEMLGDSTARDAGRLTLNPVSHIDPLGSIILPGMLMLTGSPILLGWAKPVPYDPRFLKNPALGAAQIAAAGPLSNLFVAIVFGLIIRVLVGTGAGGEVLPSLLALIVQTNILLAVFNLVPIPPLDGSKLLFFFLSGKEYGYKVAEFLERYGFYILIIFIFWGFDFIRPIVAGLFRIIVG